MWDLGMLFRIDCTGMGLTWCGIREHCRNMQVEGLLVWYDRPLNGNFIRRIYFCRMLSLSRYECITFKIKTQTDKGFIKTNIPSRIRNKNIDFGE